MANSIYDLGDIWKLVKEYKNKKKLSGGQIVPSELESIYTGGLNSIYGNQDRKKQLALQEQQIAGNQDMANKNYMLALKQLEMQKDANKAKGVQGLMQLPLLGLSVYGLGKKEGWWGNDKGSQLEGLYKYISPGSSVYDYSGMNPAESSALDMDIFSPPGSYGGNAGAGGYVSADNGTGGGLGSGIWDFFSKLFSGWF